MSNIFCTKTFILTLVFCYVTNVPISHHEKRHVEYFRIKFLFKLHTIFLGSEVFNQWFLEFLKVLECVRSTNIFQFHFAQFQFVNLACSVPNSLEVILLVNFMGDSNAFQSFRKISNSQNVLVTFLLTSAVVGPYIYLIYHLRSLVELNNILQTCIVKHIIVLFSYGQTRPK